MGNIFEILTVGNELLIGRVLNTNAHWLCGRITQMGGLVRRVTTVRDEVLEIAAAITESLSRRPDFLITVGGLGPTHDDKTLEGVASALSRPLTLNEEAHAMVKARYEELARRRLVTGFHLTPERVKMATLPSGARPIPNPVGTAPAVHAEAGGVVLFCLPGVPSEMEAIFTVHLLKLIAPALGSLNYREVTLTVRGLVESELSPLIDAVMRTHPTVYIKSHPKGEEGVPKILLHFSTTGPSQEEASRSVENAVQMAAESLRGRGGVVEATGP